MNLDTLEHLLAQVAQGKLSVASAKEKLQPQSYESLEFAKLDYQRKERTGFPEVVWGPGKTPEQIAEILLRLSKRQPVAMATRVEPAVFQAIQALIPNVDYLGQSRICALSNHDLPVLKQRGRIGILCAGTADLPVAEEAAFTAELSGFETFKIWDVGVAGLHRLLDNLPVVRQADVLIVVAGMEGALPSVVGGLASVPVIAVPTSVGYGAGFGGIAALLGMLTSCASGIGVVNIDNGFGAAMLAMQILRTGQRLAANDIP
ncbi:MAG: nickel pincer cofactor biosynthesis protein LarB [Anaerolineae bacterium]|nr:nickel pincer cofactor biosynthesis protein LarB [Gloeobacterales cyanobacterium ES-bin-313]